MNLKMMNEAFKRNYGGLASEVEDTSSKTLLRNKLNESVSRISNKDNLVLVESTMRSTIEDMYPDHSWWEVTSCVINESLFNGGIDSTISAIVEGLSESVINEDINPVHKDALRDKVRFCYSRDDLEEQGADLSQMSEEDIQRVLDKGATDADIEKMFGTYSFVDDDFGVDSSLKETVSNPDKTKGKVSKNLSKSVDKDLVRDLTLIIENDGDIYRRFTTPVINNLKRKKAKGQFDEELAVQAFVHVVENALRQPYFYRYYSYDIKTVPVPERYAVAKELLDGAMDEIEFESNVEESISLPKLPGLTGLTEDSEKEEITLDRRQPDFHSQYMDLTSSGYEVVWSGEGKIKLKYTGKSATKRREFFAEDLSDLGIKNSIIEFPSGDYVYVDYQDGKLIAGGATNHGIIPEYEVDFDTDLGVDANLENLYDEIVRNNPEFLGESLCRKLKECLRRLRESSISTEDKADSDLIRGMIAKMQKRSNAKFTPDEMAVMDKYGITRDNWTRKLEVGGRELNPDYDGKMSHSYRTYRASPGYVRTTHRNGDTSKINYADRARKLPQRDDSQIAGRRIPNGDINSHTRSGDTTLQSVERAVQADRDRAPVRDMERHISTRNFNQGRIDNAQSRYDDSVGKARKKYDDEVRWATNQYRRDTVDATQDRDAAQARIDKMLRRK